MPVPWGRAPPEHSHKQICVVDDDEWVADSLKLLLETFGFAVQSYTSGSELFSDARCRTARCLVVDQHMPGMDGLEIVERLQKEGVRVPTILISGRLDTGIRQRAANLGVAGIIEKPFATSQFVELIRSALLESN